jgi:hypothetical protein
MYSLKLIKLLLSFLVLSSISYSQEEWQDYVDWAWGGKYSPYIEADAGYGSLNHKKITGAFSKVGTLDFRFGYTELKNYKDFVQSLDERYLFGTYISSDNVGTTDQNEIKSEMWRFGLGNRLGFGYAIGNSSLIPYHQMQLVLTQPDFTYDSTLSQADMEVLNRLEGDLRMGITYEGGVKFYIARTFSINAAVEGAIVFPRYKFVHWLGSYALQAASLGVVSYFSEAIVNSSPFFGPIMYFVLKNGVAAAWYFAMKDQMYWPIESETPLAMETFRFGASFTF